MKIAILLSLITLAFAAPHHGGPHHYAAHPTSGPVYYKAIDPQLFYPDYINGQFRRARSDEAVVESEPALEVAEPVVAVAAEERKGRADEPAEAAPAPAPVVYSTPAPPAPAPPAPEPRAYPAPAPAYGESAYSFEWLVKDDYTRNDYGQKESRQGANTQGSYHVALPDGRIQTVTYHVDGYGGYVVDVQYSGEAKYPDEPAYAPAAKSYKPAPAPAYKPAPAPAYKPAPAPAYKPAPAPAPAPAPVYKPTPAPVYKPAPSYPIQPAASVRRYSFRTIADEPVAKELIPEEARSAEGIAVEVLLDEEEVAAPIAPADLPETARSDEGNSVTVDVEPVAPVEPIAPIEEAERSGEGNVVLLAEAPVETIVPVEEVVLEETARSNEGNPISIAIEPLNEIIEAEEDIFEGAESKINVVVEEQPEARQEKALNEEVAVEEEDVQKEAIVEEPVVAKIEEPVEAVEAPLNYRYYYRY